MQKNKTMNYRKVGKILVCGFCPLPFALCPLPFALCPSIFSEEWFEEETCAIFLLLQEITNSEVNQNDCCE